MFQKLQFRIDELARAIRYFVQQKEKRMGNEENPIKWEIVGTLATAKRLKRMRKQLWKWPRQQRGKNRLTQLSSDRLQREITGHMLAKVDVPERSEAQR